MQARNEYKRWLAYSALDEESRRELLSIASDDDTVEMRFGSVMSFGTAGLRSTMYAGPACMNNYTVAQATAGIAALVKQEKGSERGVAIAYDSRNHSKEFAEVYSFKYLSSILFSASLYCLFFDKTKIIFLSKSPS